MKRIFISILVILTALLCMACSDGGSATTDTPNAAEEIEAGDYDGERDENGKRSGQGVWTYDNFRYEGEWENDMPNGSGTLMRANPEISTGSPVAFVTQGQWVNGYAEGDIEYGFLYEDGHSTMWEFFVSDGRPPVEMVLTLQDGPSLVVDNSSLYAVPPFAAEVETDPSVSAPTKDLFQQFHVHKTF